MKKRMETSLNELYGRLDIMVEVEDQVEETLAEEWITEMEDLGLARVEEIGMEEEIEEYTRKRVDFAEGFNLDSRLDDIAAEWRDIKQTNVQASRRRRTKE